MRPVLLLQLGEAIDSVRAVHGHYHSWYERVWDGPMALYDGRDGGKGPDPRDFAGVVITGSARSLVRPESWMLDAADLVSRAAQAGKPVLGVCFGHQLLGHVFGGTVVENPSGWEIGSHDVELTNEGRADPLFHGLPEVVRVNLTHQDMIAQAPGRLLAKNPHTAIQAMAFAEHVRGIQFHPELSGAVTRGYVHARRELLVGQDADALHARTTDCPDGVAVLQNFRRHFVERAVQQ
jgi:GMP synthase (glutamine-hydrolysing)